MANKYPVINAGTTPTVTVLNEMLPLEAMKAGNTSRTSTTALTADPDLVFALEANATYDFEMELLYNGGTNGSSDLKFAFTGPAGYGMTLGNISVTIPAGVGIGGGTQATTFTSGTVGAGNALMTRVTGRLTTSSTAGNLTLTWAQNTSSATATTLTAGSKMRARRTA